MYSFSAFSLPVCEPLALSAILSPRSVAAISLPPVTARMFSDEEGFLPFLFLAPAPLAGVFCMEVICDNYWAIFFSVGVKSGVCNSECATVTLADKKIFARKCGVGQLKRGVLANE